MRLSGRAEMILYEIMEDVHDLRRYNIEITEITINPNLVTYKEEREIANILKLSTFACNWAGKDEKYILR